MTGFPPDNVSCAPNSAPQVKRRPKYQSVNGAWPDQVPELTVQEAVTAAKRLWRLAMGKPCPWPVVLAPGERAGRYPLPRNYSALPVHDAKTSRLVLVVSTRHGWRGLVHSLSHRCHRRLWPGKPDHDDLGRHAFLERTMIEHVVNSGWLDGRLRRPDKPSAPPCDKRALRAMRVDQAIVRWERKAKRAERALRKLRRQRAYYAQPRNGVDTRPEACA